MNGKDAVREAFKWRGGSELIVKITLDRGRPAELSEIVDVFQCLLWTAAAAEVLANYGAWIVRGTPPHPKFSEFHGWVEGLPDPISLPNPISGGRRDVKALQMWSPFFEIEQTGEQFVPLIGELTQIDRSLIGPMDLALSLQLLAVIQENPTHSWTSIKGSLIALGVAASLWSGVALTREINAPECRQQVFEVYERQSDLIMRQARLRGTMTPELAKALANVTKAATAMTYACGAVFPKDITLTIMETGRVETRVSFPRPAEEEEVRESRKVEQVHVTETGSEKAPTERGRGR